MRLRNIPGSREAVAANEFVIQEPNRHKGTWQEVFGNKNEIHIEIGMGKGVFLATLSKLNPDINYIGIEKYASVLLRAIEKRQGLMQDNLIYLMFDADYICDVFAKDEIDRIYLNFSDPWPKDRHARRRLTSKEYLARYHTFLKKNGYLAFKTDNRGLFDFSLEQTKEAGWNLKDVTYDLHHSSYLDSNVMTEYEEKFSSLGSPIHRMVAYR